MSTWGRCVHPWTANSCPSSTIRRTKAAFDSRFLPSTKNVAVEALRASSSRIKGVDFGSGPSSNVKPMDDDDPHPAMRGASRVRSPGMASSEGITTTGTASEAARRTRNDDAEGSCVMPSVERRHRPVVAISIVPITARTTPPAGSPDHCQRVRLIVGDR